MFFLLPVLAVVAETAAAVTGGVIASGTATIGGLAGTEAVRAATTIGIEAATALGTIATGGSTTALNVGKVEAGKSLVTND